MSAGLPEGVGMRLRSFYGFEPEKDGYVGWTTEALRDSYVRKLKDDDIILVYGAVAKETRKAFRSYVLGFLQIETTPIRDYERSSDASLKEKKEKGWSDKWTFGIPVKRAWRTREKVMISTIAFRSYDPAAGQALAVHGADLDADEIAQAMKIRVQEVNVFGQPPIAETESPVTPFGEVFKPSRGFPGSSGQRTANYEDGETYLYLAVFAGDGHALLGRSKPPGDNNVAMKIGVTNSVKRRCDELNAGIPPAAAGRWKISLKSQPFPDRKSAETVEELFKQRSSGRLNSIGKEFFWGRLDAAEMLFWMLPGMSRF